MTAGTDRIANEFRSSYKRLTGEDLDEIVVPAVVEELVRKHVITEGAAVILDDMYGHDEPRNRI